MPLKRGDLKRVKELLDRGANVNARDNEGRTPAEVAREEGHIDVADLNGGLLELIVFLMYYQKILKLEGERLRSTFRDYSQFSQHDKDRDSTLNLALYL